MHLGNHQHGASLPSIAVYSVTRVAPEPTPRPYLADSLRCLAERILDPIRRLVASNGARD